MDQVSRPVRVGHLATLDMARQEATQPLLVTGVVIKNRRLAAIVKSGGGGN